MKPFVFTDANERKQHIDLDQQTLQKLTFVQQKVIQILYDCSEVYNEMMPSIFVMFLRLFYSMTDHLLYVDYDKNMRKLLGFLQEVIIKYANNLIEEQRDIREALPQVLREKARLHKKKTIVGGRLSLLFPLRSSKRSSNS
jgi:hypothetical protein